MDFIANLCLFSMFWKLSTSVKCYMCDPEPSQYSVQNKLCSDFDYSEEFITDCEYSTVCFKKVTSLTFNNGATVTGVSRGCAPQLLSGDQEKKGGKWYHVKKIHEEEYKDGCTQPTDSEKITKTTQCFCRGDLCNTAPSLTASVLILIFIIGFVLAR